MTAGRRIGAQARCDENERNQAIWNMNMITARMRSKSYTM